MYEKSKTKEVVVKLPKQFISELTTHSDERVQESGDYIYVSTHRVTKNLYDSYHIREAMIKGYVEMSQINLSIACECSHAEYEAEHTTVRLVSGG
ncbi:MULTISPECIES: transcriptional regulator [Planococcaceae]|uniref:CopG family transcriptional regulator/antitoxin EndoAI n=1 Tax=Planomicrobium stackebrandtii TaxID=253160 RepID=A0ABU0GW16_9BACL|nr:MULTISPECIES: transcriptional regulator [Planococcaceae]MBT2571736.1 transcriptional regulator [Planococcus sp. ISL-110]MDQ0429558.1 CopG family transcriptional regulator/antitoxin EndoAI [Planomicrobium stackebrandtii]TWT04130.1 transcriptional regulator [Planococcus sp. CPCC 101016]